MAKTKISEFNANPALNTDIDSINIAEGCAPSGINDAIRELMSQLKDFQTGAAGDSFNGPVGTSTAAAGAFTTLSASSTLTVTGAGSIQGLTVGRGAGAVSTNTAVGASALAGSNSGTGYNTAVGSNAFAANTTGERGVAIGGRTLQTNTTGVRNSAVGMDALTSNTTGGYNSAFGNEALASNTTASSNTAVGYQALYSQVAPSAANNAFGYQAGYNITTGIQNTCIGTESGRAVTTGQQNTFLGHGSGYYMTTGSKNTIVGKYDGNQGGLDIRTSSNNIVLSDGDGNPRGGWDSGGNFHSGEWAHTDGAMFYNTATALNAYRGTSAAGSGIFGLYSDVGGTKTVRAYFRNDGGLANYSANDVNLSDERLKKDIVLAPNYLGKICAIPIKNFRYKDQSASEDITLGVIAQDVLAVAPELVSQEGFGLSGKQDFLSVYQTDLQYALMKCIQELKSELDSVKAELATLKGN